jgi:hypothetical protein
LGASNGLGQDKRLSQLAKMDYLKFKKVFRALITLRSWVTATLGHIPSAEVARYIYVRREHQSHSSCVELFSRKLARNLTVIRITLA